MLNSDLFPNFWEKKQLSDVVDFLDHLRRPITAKDREKGIYPYYGANGKQGTIDNYLFDEPLILLAEDGGYFGHPDRTIAYKVEGKTWVNNHAHVLKPKNSIDINFLLRVLERYDVTPLIKGATREKLSKSDASRIIIPLPPLHIQRHIARVLDQADQLRKQAQQMETELNALAQAVFLEMFGTVKNIVPLSKYIDFITSGSRGWAEHYAEKGARFIRSFDVQMNKLNKDDSVYVNPPDGAEAIRTRVHQNDVLLTITGSRIGRVCWIENIDEAYVSQHVAILRLNKKILPEFLSYYLSLEGLGQLQIAKAQYGQTKPGLKLSQIKEFTIPEVSLNEQQKFVAFLRKILFLEQQSKTKFQELDSLFHSLVQKAFKGELIPTTIEDAA